MNPTDIEDEQFPDIDWKEFYCIVQKPILLHAPKPLGKPVDAHMFTNSNHAGKEKTRSSYSDFLMFYNKPLADWHSKHQATIETRGFGPEVVVRKTGVNVIRGLSYKLMMIHTYI